MKTLIISMPKSGTYLCSNLLVEFGINQTYLHLNPRTYQKYNSDIEQARQYPEKYTHKETFEKSLNLFGDNEFAVTHIPYTDKRNKITQNLKRILLVREKSEIMDSYRRWNSNTGRSMPTLRLDEIRKWEKQTNMFVLSFDDMINKNVKKIDGLQLYLFDEVKFNSLKCMEKAINSPSMTKMR